MLVPVAIGCFIIDSFIIDFLAVVFSQLVLLIFLIKAVLTSFSIIKISADHCHHTQNPDYGGKNIKAFKESA